MKKIHYFIKKLDKIEKFKYLLDIIYFMIDEKDLKIIEQLKQDSRASVRNIAAATNLRPSTVHQRITKLKKDNVIEKFTVKLNNEKVNEDFIVFVLLRSEKDIDNKIFKTNAVKEVFGVTGEYDLLMKLKFPDINEFNKFIIKFRKENELTRTLTMVSTVVKKEEI